MPTIGIYLHAYIGTTGMKLYLYDGGSLLNSSDGGGDTLTESGSSGYFEATVAESLVSGTDYAALVESAGGSALYSGTLYAGETVVDVLPTSDATLAKQDEIISDISIVDAVVDANATAISEIDTKLDTVDGKVDAIDTSVTSGFTVYPLVSASTARVSSTTLTAYQGETVSFTVAPIDSNGDSVDTTGLTLEVVVEGLDKTDSETIADGAISKTSTNFTFSTSTANSTVGQKVWSCRRTDNNNVIAHGPYVVEYVATSD